MRPIIGWSAQQHVQIPFATLNHQKMSSDKSVPITQSPTRLDLPQGLTSYPPQAPYPCCRGREIHPSGMFPREVDIIRVWMRSIKNGIPR